MNFIHFCTRNIIICHCIEGLQHASDIISVQALCKLLLIIIIPCLNLEFIVKMVWLTQFSVRSKASWGFTVSTSSLAGVF